MKLQILTSSLLALAVLWMTNPLFAQDSGSGTIPAISGGIGADSREALAARTLVNQTTGEGIGQLTFSAGVAAACVQRDAARALVTYMTSSAAAETRRRHGLDPA